MKVEFLAWSREEWSRVAVSMARGDDMAK